MELCEGGELFDRISQRKRYPEREAAQVFRTLVSVVAYCQSKVRLSTLLSPHASRPVIVNPKQVRYDVLSSCVSIFFNFF